MSIKRIGLALGPLIAIGLGLVGPPEGLVLSPDSPDLNYPAWYTFCLLVWMAVWWITEPIPIAATALLPLVIVPLIGAGSPVEAAAGYSSPIIMLLLGGFIIARGVEVWNLHTRIALNIVSRSGSGPATLVGGFMVATAALSIGISNTATTLMMIPIAVSAAAMIGDKTGTFDVAVILGVVYAASIGGVTTPVSTPTNLIAIDWLRQNTGADISFPSWMMFGIPALLLLLPTAWFVVTRNMPKLEHGRAAVSRFRRQLDELGKMSAPETRVALVFGAVALLWILRPFINSIGTANDILPLAALTDMSIAMAGAVFVFLVPAGPGRGRGLLTWKEAEDLPWGVILLFGGGISLGQVIKTTGLSEWIGEQLGVLNTLPPLFFVGAVVLLVIFLTEVTSNVATMTTLAPVLGALSAAVGLPAEALLAPAAVAASCAFMLPVATAPNAIGYATGHVSVEDMVKRGFAINMAGIVIITAIGFWIAPMVL
ncbi:SLC13 family permease [Henriciella sp. AS95]|uniref:SLC13 family permease n=1 Tax=Henriciella sp. AS95 TaxID=3135782 RepID=UPI0031748491